MLDDYRKVIAGSTLRAPWWLKTPYAKQIARLTVARASAAPRTRESN
jgi:hypothetical protein